MLYMAFILFLSFSIFILSSGEGNGNPLQYSCLENPVDRGAWWAAVHRVTQSRTRLKRLSMHAWIGEGNNSPLQCSCLENPRDRGAWWAVVYGVTQSWTRLKRLSSSSIPSRVLHKWRVHMHHKIFPSKLLKWLLGGGNTNKSSINTSKKFQRGNSEQEMAIPFWEQLSHFSLTVFFVS